MRARIIHMDKEVRKTLGIYLWQIFKVKEIRIEKSGYKYKRETKWVYCFYPKPTHKEIRFYWYEVEIIE